MIRVAVIGGGLSGTLCTMQLLRQLGDRVRVTLVERRARHVQRGVAYSARLSQQLLNVQAGNMGLFPDDPGDFLRWVRSGPLPHAKADDFLPRMLYGDHVSDRFHAMLEEHRGQVAMVHGEAVSLDQHPAHGHRIQLDTGRSFLVDVVVLALGNAPPAHVPGLDPAARRHPGHIAWPWDMGALERIAPGDELLFVGAGLTMVDVLLSMEDAGHTGPVTVLSRNGRLPMPHAPSAGHTLRQPPPEAPHTVLQVMRWLRAEVRIAAAAGIPWQQVMDTVKPLAQGWWQGMDLAERQRFLRHARPHWEVHRHRMPQHVHDRITASMEAGRVRLVAGRVQRITRDDDRLRVVWRPRGTEQDRELWAAHVLNCTGPQADTRRMDQPLVEDMLAKGFVSWDPLHLGMATTPSGALVDPSGRVSESLFAVGPLCKATLWECTAVPEIRGQVETLARHIAEQRPHLQVKGWRQVLLRIGDRLALVDA